MKTKAVASRRAAGLGANPTARPPLEVDINKSYLMSPQPDDFRQYRALGDTERVYFDCTKCMRRIGTSRADLPCFWHAGNFELDGGLYENGELLCGQCLEPSARGTYQLADIWYPVIDCMAWTWAAWDDLFRDWVREEWTDLDAAWRRTRFEVRANMPASLQGWAKSPSDDRPALVIMEDVAIRAMQFAALDARRAAMEGCYEWADCGGTPLMVPGAVGWPVGKNRGFSGGLAPRISQFFGEFLDSERVGHRSEWEAFVVAWDRATRQQRKGKK